MLALVKWEMSPPSQQTKHQHLCLIPFTAPFLLGTFTFSAWFSFLFIDLKRFAEFCWAFEHACFVVGIN